MSGIISRAVVSGGEGAGHTTGNMEVEGRKRDGASILAGAVTSSFLNALVSDSND